MSNQINLNQLITVAEALGDIKDSVVFVGGSTTILLVDAVGTGKARQTEDVDFIIDIAVITEQAKFEEQMRQRGFRHDTSEDAPICRWLIEFLGHDLKVDAMPTKSAIFGFTNRWYEDAIKTCWKATIKEGLHIQVVDPVHFLGTKFEAYKGRGNGDIYSHDMEDIIFVLEHNSNIETLVFSAPEHLKSYLKHEFTQILTHPSLTNSLAGMLDDKNAVTMVLAKMKFISTKC